MNRQFWIMVKQFLLFLLLSQGIMAIGMVAALSDPIQEGLEEEAAMEQAMGSKITICAIILGYLVTIAVFLGKRYVRISTGRIDRSSLWKTVGMAALIAWGWMFTEISILLLVDADKLFPDEAEELEQLGKLMGGALGGIAVGILGPIAEEIGFRGVLMGGLLRMRCHPWVAIAVSAIVFSFFHGTHLQLLGTMVFGSISGWLYWRTRSLIPSMIIHIVNNSTAVVLEMTFPDEEPGKKLCVLFIVVFLPLLLIGLNWFKHGRYLPQYL